jgi:hypothetical protein
VSFLLCYSWREALQLLALAAPILVAVVQEQEQASSSVMIRIANTTPSQAQRKQLFHSYSKMSCFTDALFEEMVREESSQAGGSKINTLPIPLPDPSSGDLLFDTQTLESSMSDAKRDLVSDKSKVKWQVFWRLIGIRRHGRTSSK